jgi:hypothetical protein
LAEANRWESLRTYFSTKPGVPTKTFAHTAIEKKNSEEALHYIRLIPENEQKVMLLAELGCVL